MGVKLWEVQLFFHMLGIRFGRILKNVWATIEWPPAPHAQPPSPPSAPAKEFFALARWHGRLGYTNVTIDMRTQSAIVCLPIT